MKRTLFAAASVALLAACQPAPPAPAATASTPVAGATQAAPPAPVIPLAGPIGKWMAWEGGVDLVAVTKADLQQPNVILHVARMVHTPTGAGPAGMVLFQPDPAEAPLAIGFVGPDVKLGAYFGPNIFAGTPFETAPVVAAKIEIDSSKLPASVSSKITVGGHVFEVELSELGPTEFVSRVPGKMSPEAPLPPFAQQGLEAKAGKATLKVDGKPVDIIVPPVGISGGPAAVWSPTGLYGRQ
jgi:hypothetical protein